jgi:hypothetical protein
MIEWIQRNRVLTLLLALHAALTAAMGAESEGGSAGRAILAVTFLLTGMWGGFYLEPLAREDTRPLVARLILSAKGAWSACLACTCRCVLQLQGHQTHFNFQHLKHG